MCDCPAPLRGAGRKAWCALAAREMAVRGRNRAGGGRFQYREPGGDCHNSQSIFIGIGCRAERRSEKPPASASRCQTLPRLDLTATRRALNPTRCCLVWLFLKRSALPAVALRLLQFANAGKRRTHRKQFEQHIDDSKK